MWDLLRMFWTASDVQDLLGALQNEVNNLGDGLLMKVEAHRLWDDMDFYLEVD